jgi:hypothetical protein
MSSSSYKYEPKTYTFRATAHDGTVPVGSYPDTKLSDYAPGSRFYQFSKLDTAGHSNPAYYQNPSGNHYPLLGFEKHADGQLYRLGGRKVPTLRFRGVGSAKSVGFARRYNKNYPNYRKYKF